MLASVGEMFAWHSPSAKKYREKRDQLTDDDLIDLMLAEPRLIRRPILILDDTVLFGFRSRDYQQALGN